MKRRAAVMNTHFKYSHVKMNKVELFVQIGNGPCNIQCDFPSSAGGHTMSALKHTYCPRVRQNTILQEQHWPSECGSPTWHSKNKAHFFLGEFWCKGLLGWRAREETPYGAASIAFGSPWADGISGLKWKVFLNAVHRGEIVVFHLAKLQEAVDGQSLFSCSASF